MPFFKKKKKTTLYNQENICQINLQGDRKLLSLLSLIRVSPTSLIYICKLSVLCLKDKDFGDRAFTINEIWDTTRNLLLF